MQLRHTSHKSLDLPTNGMRDIPADTAKTTVFQQVGGWQARAAEAYHRAQVDGRANPRLALARAVLHLTGRTIAPEVIVEDHRQQRATATVDGVIFRMNRQGLVLLRACAYCGTGQFESIPLQDETDLGFALSVWRPLHETCRYADPDEMMDGI